MARSIPHHKLTGEERNKFNAYSFFSSLAIPGFLGFSLYHFIQPEYWEGGMNGLIAMFLCISLLGVFFMKRKKQVPIPNKKKKMPEKKKISPRSIERNSPRKDLKQENDLLKSIMHNAPIAIYVKDLEGRYLFINHKGLEWLGVSIEEISGSTDHQLFSPEVAARSRKEDLEVIQTQTPIEIERSQMLEDGLFAVHISKFPLFGSDGKIAGVCGMTYNITEHKQAEEEICRLNEKLQQHITQRTTELEMVRRELNVLVHTVSQILKTPMHGIMQPAVWLVKNYAKLFDERGKKMAALLINRIKWMDESLEGIGQYFNLDYADESIQQIDLNVLVNGILTHLAPSPYFQIWVRDHLPAIVGDQTRIKQIFQNLLSNALKFMDTQNGEIAVDCVDEGSHWTFSVADNGPGIAPEYHEKIFHLFQTAIPDDEQKHAGIGLAIVQKNIEHYGGQIWVESAPGQGSTFFFTFPKTS